ncbi:MAG: hypothetical protein WD269_12330 [Acidimicrobiia bacterium]
MDAATATTHLEQPESGSTSTLSGGEPTFLTVGDGAFIGRVVSVEFGDEWAITPSDVAVTPGAAAGTTVGPAILHLDDGTTLEVPAGTPGGNGCIELVRPEDWAAITGLENPTLEQLRRNDIPYDCFIYGALTPGGQVAWFDIAAEYRAGDPTSKLLRRPVRLVEDSLIVEGDLGFRLAPDVEILCLNQLTIEEYAADLLEHASRSVIEISTSTGEITTITCNAEI